MKLTRLKSWIAHVKCYISCTIKFFALTLLPKSGLSFPISYIYDDAAVLNRPKLCGCDIVLELKLLGDDLGRRALGYCVFRNEHPMTTMVTKITIEHGSKTLK